MNKLVLTALSLLSLFVGKHANAELVQVSADVKDVGCHIDKNTCFVYLDTADIQTQCAHNDGSLRWDVSPENGQAVLSLILAAKMTSKTLVFGLDTKRCYDNWPTFSWVNFVK